LKIRPIKALTKYDFTQIILPILIEQTLLMLMGVINVTMISSQGSSVISGIGIVDSINNIIVPFFSALSVGATVVIANYRGRGEIDNCNEMAKQSFYMSMIIVVIISAILLSAGPFTLNLMFKDAEKSVLDSSNIYMIWSVLSYPAVAISAMFSGIRRGSGDTVTPMKITILMNIINITLCAILVYGVDIPFVNVHFKSYGVLGAGIGIFVARTVGALLSIFYLFFDEKKIGIKDPFKFKLNKVMQLSFIGVGIPVSMENILFNLGKLFVQVFITSYGTFSLTANSYCGTIFNALTLPGNSLNISVATLVGREIGKRNKKKAKRLMIELIVIASMAMAVLCIVITPFIEQIIILLFNPEPEVVQISVNLIRICAVFLPLFWSIAFILPGGLRSAGDAKFTMFISITTMWVVRITFGYFLGTVLEMKLAGIWLAMCFDWVARGIIFVIRLVKDKWQQKQVIKD